MRRVSAFLLTASVLGCGVNVVTVEIKGGDGNRIRLDANDLEFGRNRLVEAGTFVFSEIKRGTYSVGVVAGTYHDRRTIELESAPISGVEAYSLVFQLPAGSNVPSERSGTILFASSKTNITKWDLFTVKADGSGLTQLTTGREFEQHPTWSPDGKSILFTRGEVMTNIDIYVMGEDGSDARRLTEHPERDNRPDWSPDGSRIAFVSQRDGDVAVWVMDGDGQNKRKLVKGRDPSWSPDGSQIAFVSGQFGDSDEIYLIRPDGTDMRTLTENKKFDWFPAWSLAGDHLVFCSERFGGQELIVSTAEEILRWTSPVLQFARTPTEDFELAGVKIKAGEDVGMWYPSANRDEAVFDRPYDFDITRKPNRHLAFGGYGAHFCLGANLARWELRAAIRALVPVLPEMELASGPERCPNLHVSAIHRLAVRPAA